MAAEKAPSQSKCTTRQKLIDAAHHLIWANSYAHVSVDEICKTAEVHKGSFYHFFPTKHDLAAAAMEEHWLQSRPKLDAIFTDALSPAEQLKALCREMLKKQQDALDSTGKVCGCPYATVASEMTGNNEALRALSEQMTERFCGYFEQLLTRAAEMGLIEPTQIRSRAQEMHIYAIGAMMQARITNSLAPVGPTLEAALLRMSGMEDQHSS